MCPRGAYWGRNVATADTSQNTVFEEVPTGAGLGTLFSNIHYVGTFWESDSAMHIGQCAHGPHVHF